MERELQYLARQFVMHGAMSSEEFACDLVQIILSHRKKTAEMLVIAQGLGAFMKPAGGDGD